ncbi:MAG: nascent polypeptide-associated complex protein [Candidatus Bathyarchaeia archaeon]
MAKIDSRKTRRLMKQMGLRMDELGDIQRVIMQGSEREIIIENPIVTSLDLKGQKMYQITGGRVSEKTDKSKGASREEDILLVAQQAGVSREMAKAALEETEWDLASAILKLTSKK